MDELEKVERLRERANVSYDEAKDALRACNGDLLDAMVYLEKLGKVQGPGQASFTTNYTDSPKYRNVSGEVHRIENRAKAERFGAKIKAFAEKAWKYGNENHLVVTHKTEQFIDLPLWVVVLVGLAAWHILLILIFVSLFFDFHYRLEGTGNLAKANEIMDKVQEATSNAARTFSEQEVDNLASKYDSNSGVNDSNGQNGPTDVQ